MIHPPICEGCEKTELYLTLNHESMARESQSSQLTNITDLGHRSVNTPRIFSKGKSSDDCQIEDTNALVQLASPSIRKTHALEYITVFTSLILSRLGHNEILAVPSGVLPDLIKAFAIKIWQELPNPANRDIMAFIHKHP